MKNTLILLIVLFTFNTYAMEQGQLTQSVIQDFKEIKYNDLDDSDKSIHDQILNTIKEEVDRPKLSKKEKRKLKKAKRKALRKSKKKWRTKMFCSHAGGDFIIGGSLYKCTNFRGRRFRVSTLGIGVSFSGKAGFAIIKSRDEDPEGLYSYFSGGGWFIIGGSHGEANKKIKDSLSENNPKEVSVTTFGFGLGIEANWHALVIEEL
jgi:hypothetical protein